MANEIIIVVKARNETRGLFAEVEKEATVTGNRAGDNITERITERIKVIKDDPTIRNAGAPIGDVLGRTISEHITERITTDVQGTLNRDITQRLHDSSQRVNDTVHEKIKLDVDNDFFGKEIDNAIAGKNSKVHKKVKVDVDLEEGTAGSGFHKFIDNLETNLRSGLGSALSSVFSVGSLTTVLKVGAVAAIGAVLAPAAGAAVTSGILLALGGGVIGAGMYAAVKNDPQLKGAIGELKSMVGKAFAHFGDSFKPAVANLLDGGTGKAGLVGVLKQVQPMIDQIAHDLGPIADHLSAGVVGFLQNALPGVLRAIDKSGPIIDTLADKLPKIGTALGKFFDDMGNRGPQAAEFFGDLLEVIGLIIRGFGRLVSGLTNAYANMKVATLLFVGDITALFGTILHAADRAFGWLPGIGPKLHAAAGKFDAFQADVNKQLQKIHDKNVEVKIHAAYTGAASAINAVGALLAGRASGGITGSASGATPSGLTWVGEHGPELMSAPAGSRVYSNPDSMRMAAAAGGGGGPLTVVLQLDGHQIAGVLVDPQRRIIRQQYGGSVQAAYGYGVAA